MKADPTQESLRLLFDYDSSGALKWRVSRNGRIRPGSHAGCVSVRLNRCLVRTLGRLHFRYRLIWIWHNGQIPSGMQVDHINRNSLDDRIGNLRLATRSQNMMNAGARKTNKCGLKGTSWCKKTKKWRAATRFDGKHRTLGYFSTPSEAHAAYCEFVTKRHGEYARTK